MTLTGAQLSRIHKAILDAYDRDELRQMILACMDEDFSRHVSPEKRFSAQVFEFVEWANRQDRALELLRCAAEGNERNAGLQTLWAEAQTWDAPVQPAKAKEPSVSPAAPHHVFLAYSRKDSEVMRRLRADLLAAGIVAWIDQDDLEPGTPVWQRAIEGAIRVAKCVVVILTPEAKESDWVNIEISFARRIGRRTFPILARGDEDSAVPFMLEATHRIDIRTDYAGSVQGKLIPALRKHLGMTDAVTPPLPRDSAPGKPLAVKEQQPASARTESAKPSQSDVASAGAKQSSENPALVVPKPTVLKPTSSIDIEWVTIPAGEFLMGSDMQTDKQASDDETPQHRLHLPEYRIAQYPITNAQYQVFVKATSYQAPSHWNNGIIPKGKEHHPVVNVSWLDAQAFCKWANVRLPTEAEWEKAARGADGRIWPWGNEPPTKELCNYGGNVSDTTPVGNYPKGASPYGCFDMAGNVWEWTGSLYKPYLYQPDDGRENPNVVGRRTRRGSSWLNRVDNVRCAVRDYNIPRDRGGDVGFRVLSPGF